MLVGFLNPDPFRVYAPTERERKRSPQLVAVMAEPNESPPKSIFAASTCAVLLPGLLQTAARPVALRGGAFLSRSVHA